MYQITNLSITNLFEPAVLPLSIYFREDWHDYKLKFNFEEFNRKKGVELCFCACWSDLDSALASKPHQIIVHISMLKRLDISIPELVAMLETKLKLAGLSIPIGAGIDIDTPVSMIKELQQSGIFGIVPSAAQWGTDEVIAGIHALRDRTPYWPDHIIGQLPADPRAQLPRVVSVRIIETDPKTKLIVDNLQCALQVHASPHYNFNFCTEWGQFSRLVAEPTDLVLFHCNLLRAEAISASEIFDMICSMTKFSSGKSIKIAAIIDKDTPQERIKELRKLDICGIVPAARFWGVDTATLAIVHMLNGNPNWPKDIIDQLSGAAKKVKSETLGIRLTARQFEVMELICKRGLTNKGVAKMLKISESTVKIHVSAVMKAYGVRTRTQLALTASSGLKA